MSLPRIEGSRTRPSAYLAASISRFLATDGDAALGVLVKESAFDVELQQRDAWRTTIDLLRDALVALDGHLFFEFDVPRLGSRIDAVVIAGGAIVPIEFKVGEMRVTPAHRDQVWDYALDLRNFHQASHHAPIFPLVVATGAVDGEPDWPPPAADGVRPPRAVTVAQLGDAVRAAASRAGGAPIDGDAWGRAGYQPTPTIVQAARALYARHTVHDITRSEAGATNLAVTARRVQQLVNRARDAHEKAIVFVTGVPGAGKTLVGLDIATARRDHAAAGHAVFLSGNGPLVAVLREALTRDELSRLGAAGIKRRKGDVAQPIKQFIQNVHHFRDEGLRRSDAPPHDRVVIFDEAQRAWTREKTSLFMRQRKGRPDFNESEPEFLISYMDRHADWAVVICLVGGGQEIHTGEAGIGAWLTAMRERFPHWQVHLSPHLAGAEYAAQDELQALADDARCHPDPSLHLATSMRSFRAQHVAEFVRAVLALEHDAARVHLRAVLERYPLAITRSLDTAKRWVRAHARGSERYGLIASSQAMRLKPHAIDVRVSVDPVQWFLGPPDDTRASWYLEDAATEFQVQGLEVDWACVTWDADLRLADGRWHPHAFRGDRWERMHKPERQRYLLNAYRVLLTRARQGMVVFVPPGEATDRTRSPQLYDQTYGYLRDLGIPEI
ncbi:MAG: DUF2075 domain-containing protein [Gemmatimonadaceae bacterium]|nr:DUF2075 domain-containing protein [Gemmatimonadaceae bacterium]